MSAFVDRVLLELSDPLKLAGHLAPAGDTTKARLRTLINAVYELPFATIHDIRDLKVLNTELQRPVFSPQRTTGTWTQTVPGYTRTDLTLNQEDRLRVVWLDLLTRLSLTLVMEVDEGKVATILNREISGFTTLDEFRNNFRFIDLDAFMEEHGITTVEELRAAYQYLLTEIHLQTPPVFDANDPANHHRYQLNVAILIHDAFDMATALRDAKLARAVLEQTITYLETVEDGDVRTPYAVLMIFPTSTVPGGVLTEDAIKAFFALERVLVLFLTLS